MRAGGREAQRPGECRVYETASHGFRDAGEFFVWGLFQEGRGGVCVGADYFARVVWDSEGQIVCDDFWRS